MAVNSLIREQVLHTSINEAWDFFTNPNNLSSITPKDMKFIITSKTDIGASIYPGQIITYKVSPLFNIPMFWMTEITHVSDKKLFVDEQRKGPYKLWHHQHIFKEVGNGILMTDIVHYELPLMALGSIAQSLFVKKQLNKIFDYRYSVLEKIYNSNL